MTDRDAVVDGVVAAIELLQRLGYIVGIGAVDVGPDATVVFHLAEDDPVFVKDLADIGFDRPYELDFRPTRHHIHPRPR